MIVLDTHVLWWWTIEPRALSRPCADAVAEAPVVGGPTICFWEITMLVCQAPAQERLHGFAAANP